MWVQRVRRIQNKQKSSRAKRRIGAAVILLFCVCAVIGSVYLQMRHDRSQKYTSFLSYAGIRAQESVYQHVVDYYMPILSAEQQEPSLLQCLTDRVMNCFPVYTYAMQEGVEQASESRVSIAARDEEDYEEKLEGELERQLAAMLEEENESWKENYSGSADGAPQDFLPMQSRDVAGGVQRSLFSYATEKVQQVDLKELEDYRTLVQKYYRIDGTTESNASQLNVKKLLKKDLSIKPSSEGPQILIYHTHASEGFRDSKQGDASETVVGLGDYLCDILTERYGYNVLHDKGVYDSDRDLAYGVAGPALKKILKQYPSIEVVIDLHRDGVGADTYLQTEVNDTVMAPVMFFNGLSYTKKNGALTSLKNPYLQTNLAFSLQMELLASEYYPGFSRGIYLKGLRYNMHYCPKSLLVEVGAQTNSLQEAMNAMPPLADLLNRVLSGEKP